jgi:hypothetical protein
MAPYEGSLDNFVSRTPAKDWWEGLLKGLVGHGVARDFALLLARGLDPVHGAAISSVLAEFDSEDSSGREIVRVAIAEDSVLASRLGLWGRRVVGEVLKLVVDTLAMEPFAQIASAAGERAGAGPFADRAAVVSWALGELKATHSARMEGLGLVP